VGLRADRDGVSFRAPAERSAHLRRAPIVAVGLAATGLAGFLALPLWLFMLYESQAPIRVVLAFGLAGAAIAAPLFGTMAASYHNRWSTLVTGCALGAFVLIVMFAILRLGY
jgi:uncharacterized membrane protein YeaQ/YmgE (transglycosylase-associated protein family)